MPAYLARKLIRRLPGAVIKAVPLPEVELIEGYGARGRVGKVCKGRFDNVMIVTDQTLFSLGYHLAITDALQKEGIRYTVFSGISSEPTTDIIKEGRRVACDCKAEAIVALGGGSVMDSVKMIAAGARLRAVNEHLMLLKFLIVPWKTLPIINIPSTAGTGAELTVGAVVTDTLLRSKSSTVIVGLNIQTVILDSQLTENAPAAVTAACGIDALSHGLEGCVAHIRSGADDEMKSRECVKLVLENLPKVLTNPHDIDARQAMCRAAHYGGNAINRQLAGYVHAFAHSIGATYHIPHGNAIAVSIMPVMEAQKSECVEKLAQLARYCGIAAESGSGAGTEMAAAEAMLQAIEALVRNCGAIPQNFAVPVEDYKNITRKVCLDSINYCAPKIFRDKEIHKILWHIQNQK